MKTTLKILLALYVLLLLWLVLFKLSSDLPSVLLDFQARSLSLIPFAAFSRGEMLSNFIVFIPFGLLLSANFKQINLRRKLVCIFIFSVVVEMMQFILAIGVSDITDVITNTLGGLLGLLVYAFGDKYVKTKRLDQFIAVAGMVLFVVFGLLRVFVFKVRY